MYESNAPKWAQLQSSNQIMLLIIAIGVFLDGWYIASYGPLIPLFSQKSGLDQTDYSYIFFVKSIANIAGGFFVKILLRHFSRDVIYKIITVVIVFSLFITTLSVSTLNLSVCLFLSSFSLVVTAVIAYDITFQIFKEASGYWMQMIGFFFSAGAMCGPYLVSVFKLATYQVISILYCFVFLLLLKFHIPNPHNKRSQEQKLLIKAEKTLGQKSVILLSLIFFFYASEELGISGWIATYSIKAGVADVQSSALYSLLFWVPNCLFKLVWMHVPGRIDYKMKISLKAVCAVMLVSIALQAAEMYGILCAFMSIGAGIFTAGVYDFGFSLPVENGFMITPEVTSNFILGLSLGQGLLTMPIGYCMQFFGFKALTVLVFVFSIACYFVFEAAVKEMQRDRIAYEAKNQINQELI